MAELRAPSPSQLEQARAALLPMVVPYRFAGEAPSLWRAAHQALCRIEDELGLPHTVPTREVRRGVRGTMREAATGEGEVSA